MLGFGPTGSRPTAGLYVRAAPSGSSFFETISDSVTAGESFTVKMAGAPALAGGTAGSTDSFTVQMIGRPPVSWTAITSDSISVSLAAKSTLTDSVLAGESLAVSLAAKSTLTDSVLSLDESVAVGAFAAAVGFTATAKDSLTNKVGLSLTIADSLSLSDSLDSGISISTAFSILCVAVGQGEFSLDSPNMTYIEDAPRAAFIVDVEQMNSGPAEGERQITVSEVPEAVVDLKNEEQSRC